MTGRGLTLGSRYVFAATFWGLGTVLLVTRRESWVWTAALTWLSVDLWLVGLAYLLNWTRIFGKTARGSLQASHVVLMLPYLFVTWGVWHFQNLLSREPIWAQIAPDLFVGRKCRSDQMPPQIVGVIDFTAEFPGDKSARRTLQWLSIPVLDGCAPISADYRNALSFLNDLGQGAVYLCCANGHGRSVTGACVLLVKRGEAATLDEALGKVSERRPRASLNREQRQSLGEALKG